MTETVTIGHGPWTARIDPLGAQLRGLAKDGVELLWPGDPDGWKDTAPWLFPVVGRLWEDCLRCDGAVHPHPMHGLVRRERFELVEHAADRLRLRLERAACEAFPWDYTLDIGFSLGGEGLAVQVRVVNSSCDRELPFQLGWHPGFAGCSFRVAWERPQPLEILEVVPGEGWRTGTVRRLGEDLTEFVWEEQPTAWVTGLEARVLRLEGGAFPLRLHVEPAPLAWVFWQRPGQEFLCLEPWFGLPDKVGETCGCEDREGTRRLGPGEEWSVTMGIGVV